MKVLMLSIDELIFQAGSETQNRMKRYGGIVEELHIVVFSKNQHEALHIGNNIFVYPAYASERILGLVAMYRMAKKIFFYSKSSQRWLITSQDAVTNLVGIFLKKRFAMPLEIQIHTDFLSAFFRRESLKNYFRYFLYRYSLRHADCIRVVSERIRQSLKKKFPGIEKKLYVLPVFIDAQAIQKQSYTIDLHRKYPQADFIILMASRLTPEKNIPLALKAFESLYKKYPHSLLLIVGDGSERKNLESRIKHQELNQNVIIEPAIPLQELMPYFKSADLFLLTSNYEGYGRTIIEALVSKLPIVMTDVGIAGEIVSNGINGTVIPVGDSRALREALFKIVQDYGYYQKLASAGGELLQTFSKYSEDYFSIVKNRWEKCVIKS